MIQHPSMSQVRRLLSLFMIAASSWYVGVFIAVACLRASFPMQLEWVESGVLDAVDRVLAHKAVYVAPTHLYVPYLYTPLYYHAGAWVCRLAGPGLAPLRWLSIACTLICFGLLFRLTQELTSSARAGLFAMGCFAGLYRASAGSFDLARVDMLCIALMLAAIYAVWRDQMLLAGLLFACAYQTKQGAAIVAVCALAGTWRRPRSCFTGLATFFVLTAGSSLYLNHISDGWYAFYTQWLPRHHPLDSASLAGFFVRDLGRYMLPALLLIAWTVRGNLHDLWSSFRGNFLLSCTLGVFIAAAAGRFHAGGSANSTLPLYAWFTVLFALALHQQLASAEDQQSASLKFVALAALQFLVMFAPPSHFLPTRAATQEARRFLQQVAAYPGDIYVVDAAADLDPAHKANFANGVAAWDVVRAGDSAASRALIADLQQAIRHRSYTALLSPYQLDNQHGFVGAPSDLGRYYQLDVPPFRSGEAARELKVLQTPQIGPVYLYPFRP
jgi:Glycosyltransferase family 87